MKDIAMKQMEGTDSMPDPKFPNKITFFFFNNDISQLNFFWAKGI